PRPGVDKDGFMRYRASQHDCQSCALKPQCCPRPTPMSHPGASERRSRMLFAHLKRILKFDRLRLRGPNSAKNEFHLAATAQNLRKLAKLIPIQSAIAPA
ncbi:transposase, partial [Sphingobium yanoikuyae]|uniref:transposase n=1 Tax=Sphingobium yanoikuyae TaxID=13690 RepID=UPI0035C702D6